MGSWQPRRSSAGGMSFEDSNQQYDLQAQLTPPGDGRQQFGPEYPMSQAQYPGSAYGLASEAGYPSYGSYQQEFGADKGLDEFTGGAARWAVFPQVFTAVCFAMFGVPVTLCLYLHFDRDVQFWIGTHLLLVVFLPLMFLATHCFHNMTGRPSRVGILLCMIGSSGLLIVLTDILMVKSRALTTELLAQDCSNSGRKYDVEMQYQQALGFYSNCTQARAQAEGTTVAQQVATHTIEACDGYDTQLSANTAWPYLAALETSEGCAGWCTRGQPVWTFNAAKDSCSLAAGANLEYKVYTLLFKAFCYSIVAFGFSAVFLVLVAP
eukprot:CAMPEP_0178415358 /NCGR_PEP_ID=MMETSP0689_2-20121128/23510_1 /TAXON_ID=160604 /ORGANISM="Amphidinium massartii, Strain CS-259" /LENGTH=321 /DNA_ID=CAMNT_0020036675 /DNA_START=296 /DNA_END=1258 /DNA_ORIENTATION=+